MTVRSLSVLLISVLATLALAACGDSVTPTPTSSPTPAPTATPTFTTNASGQRIAADGNTVSVHYRGTLANGEEFDTSRGGLPISFVVGAEQTIPGFDNAVRGMAMSEAKTITIPPEEGYGIKDGAPPQTAPIELLPDDFAIGEEFELEPDILGRVLAVEGEFAWVQINHRLAGETLTFEIEVVDIQ